MFTYAPRNLIQLAASPLGLRLPRPQFSVGVIRAFQVIVGHFNEFGGFFPLFHLFTFLLMHLHPHVHAPSPCFNRLFLFLPTQYAPARLTFSQPSIFAICSSVAATKDIVVYR